MSFYNINNELISQETILTDLIEYYQSLTDAGKSKIDDFNEGSEARNLLEVLSHLAYNILEEQNETLRNHFINTADGEYLDLLGSNPNVNLPREQGTTASGLVKFSIPYNAFEEMTIPADLTVSSDSAEYVTIEDGIIPIGDNYTYVPVECVIDGVEGNCPVGAITTCELSDYTVTNEEVFNNGSDFEEDEEYRERLLEFIRADNFGSRGYYENLLLNVDGVHDILQNPSPEAAVNYYINTNDKSNVNQVYNEILSIFTDNNSMVLGHDFQFLMSEQYEITFSISINSDCGYSKADINDYFHCYFKGGDMENYPISHPGLNMGEEVTSKILTDALKTDFPEITYAEIFGVINTKDGNTTFTFEFTDDELNNAYVLKDIGVTMG